MRTLLLIAGAWAVGSLLLGLLIGRIIRRVGRRYPVSHDTGIRGAERGPGGHR